MLSFSDAVLSFSAAKLSFSTAVLSFSVSVVFFSAAISSSFDGLSSSRGTYPWVPLYSVYPQLSPFFSVSPSMRKTVPSSTV